MMDELRMQRGGFSRPDLLVSVAVVLVLVGLMSLYGPHYRRARKANECHYNLRMLSANSWAFVEDHSGRWVNEVPVREGGSYEYRNSEDSASVHFRALFPGDRDAYDAATCLSDAGKETTAGKVKNKNLSYFLTLNWQKDDDKWIVAGGRNITLRREAIVDLKKANLSGWHTNYVMHGLTGYVLLNDGSIELYDTSGLFKRLEPLGTNRVAVP